MMRPLDHQDSNDWIYDTHITYFQALADTLPIICTLVGNYNSFLTSFLFFISPVLSNRENSHLKKSVCSIFVQVLIISTIGWWTHAENHYTNDIMTKELQNLTYLSIMPVSMKRNLIGFVLSYTHFAICKFHTIIPILP